MLGRRSGLCSIDLRGLSQPLFWRARQVRALLWPLFARSAWAQPSPVLASRQVWALLWPLFARSAWAQPDTVVAGTTGVGAALAFVRSFVVGSNCHCGGDHVRSGRCSGLCSLCRRCFRQPLWRLARHVKALLWPIFTWSARAQAATVVACTKVERAALAYVRLIGEGSASHCVGGH
jgi:hypothetical protein